MVYKGTILWAHAIHNSSSYDGKEILMQEFGHHVNQRMLYMNFMIPINFTTSKFLR